MRYGRYVIARVNTPGNQEAFEELGVNAISATDSISQSMDDAIERPRSRSG